MKSNLLRDPSGATFAARPAAPSEIPFSPRRGLTGTLTALVFAGSMLVWQRPASAEESAVMIMHPQPEQTIYDNTGYVPVSVTLQSMPLVRDNRLRVLIDGKPYGADQSALEFTLRDVERGEHSLQVQLVDTSNAVLALSTPVKFYVWQASVLLPTRKPAAPPAK